MSSSGAVMPTMGFAWRTLHDSVMSAQLLAADPPATISGGKVEQLYFTLQGLECEIKLFHLSTPLPNKIGMFMMSMSGLYCSCGLINGSTDMGTIYEQ